MTRKEKRIFNEIFCTYDGVRSSKDLRRKYRKWTLAQAIRYHMEEILLPQLERAMYLGKVAPEDELVIDEMLNQQKYNTIYFPDEAEAEE